MKANNVQRMTNDIMITAKVHISLGPQNLHKQLAHTISYGVCICFSLLKVALYKDVFPPIFHLKTAVTFLILHQN